MYFILIKQSNLLCIILQPSTICSPSSTIIKHYSALQHGLRYAFKMSMFMCPAVHTMTHSLLRSSSTHEPSDPPLRVIQFYLQYHFVHIFIERNQKYTNKSLIGIYQFLQ